MIDRTLSLPEHDYKDALVAFSPNLELLFIGNMVANTMKIDGKPLHIPIQFLHQNTVTGPDQEIRWNGSFSPCSKYFMLFLDPMDAIEQSAELHLFHIGTLADSLDELTFPDLDIAPFGRLGVSFHPYRSHIVLLSGQKAIPRHERETTCQLLDIKAGRVEGLGSQSHPKRCK